MFLFGVKALEQFLDRMIELPQYCNNILQISHLRCTHPEIVSSVKQSLSRISSGLTPTAGQFRGSLSLANPEIQVSSSPQTPPTGSTSKSIQQQQSSLEDKQEGSLNLPVLTPNVQPLVIASSDAASSQKSKSAVGSSEILAASTSFTLPSPSSLPKFGGAENIETLVAAAKKREIPIEAPASEIQDKISFIMNNLSISNTEEKSKELTEYLKEEHYSWFAQYLVMKRLSIERNHHEMYLMFLEKINSKTLNHEVLQFTYENCKVLLASELLISSSEERELLRNLGSWLGMITIGSDQYLRRLDINPKLLIIKAYEKGLMFAIVPFISRILEAVKTTRAYIPPNPWTMAVLGLLVEIHSFPNLKLNLKFAIEVLFKKIGVNMVGVKPTSLLKNRVRKVEGSLDFSSNDLELPESHKVTEVNFSTSSTSNQTELLQVDIINPSHSSHSSSHSVVSSQHAAAPYNTSAALTEDDKADHLQLFASLPATQRIPQSQPLISFGQFRASTSDIEQQVIVNPKLNTLGLQLQFQSLLPIAMDRAIKDMVSSIIQRIVSLATRTTKGLVMKDFAMESDEKCVYNAARNMVTSLACGLAHATCKEPLRISISRQLRNLLQNSNISGELLEQIAQIVTDDNLNLGFAMILQVVTEKAMQNIDVEVGKEIIIKRMNRELNVKDENPYAQGLTAVLPQSLCPIPGSLFMSQRQVYEDFATLPVETVSNLTKVYSIGEENAATPQHLEEHAVRTSVASSSAPELQSAKPCKTVKLGEIARIPNAASVGNSNKNLQSGGEKVAAHFAAIKEGNHTDLPDAVSSNFDEKVSKLFAEWYSIFELAGSNNDMSAKFVLKLFENGVLNGDYVTNSFFHILLEISVSHCLSSSEVDNPITQQSNQLVKQSLSFLAIDMYANLVLSILKFYPGGEDLDKLSILLSKVLTVTVNNIQKDAEAKKKSFNPIPYYRLFVNWLMDLPSLEPLSDGVNLPVMIALANAFHLVPPLRIPGFSYAWVELVSHRNFMPKFIVGNGQKGWPYYQRLLIHLIQFLEPYLRNAELTEPVSLLYNGTLRVFLVLLHDFPEFLCDYHFSFCDIIPSSCIQLRNVILGAFPRHTRLPDPSSPNFKIDLLAEITQPPRILSEVDSAIKTANIKRDIDAYIMTRQQSCLFIHELKQKLILNHDEASRRGTRYNVPLINSIVLYVGMQTIDPSIQAVELFKRLMLELDTEGRYLFLNAMTNQLRHPNTHTYYFYRIILHLFNISNQELIWQEVIQEQISRVLLERVIVARPHPWGLLVTFVELLKNPVYDFWGRRFIECAPEIAKLFEKEYVSVLRSWEEPNLPDDIP
jgi:CCR4-NOT transcription complex subunit 1